MQFNLLLQAIVGKYTIVHLFIEKKTNKYYYLYRYGKRKVI